MLTLYTTTQFRKDVKRMRKRGLNLEKLNFIIEKLLKGEILEPKYRDHDLVGNYIGFRECHIEPDWLLIYKIDKGKLILTASRTGSHSDLF
ncbi:type II toxin-antitoxin system YafQ family toxin [Gemelliphila palaticanis]|uniref:Type II toxin-antitoxin system YafQ family toxin n=1 Tax=Gemelliphila palaticanis TaxID=81950 RepID=A0ABX2SYN3_9BACL|nr:type II toxin-antitoxin system YafQ family toxin [Gemella palaticanis]MBF0715006.1 type II toxin-antitoxin system YafQ family toxin [Gemella palaticanis]NYS46936.1 type II toxin-antitoxin system YafQ family toxin [Gemella palaticanis]